MPGLWMAGVKIQGRNNQPLKGLSHANLVFDDAFLQLTVCANEIYTTNVYFIFYSDRIWIL